MKKIMTSLFLMSIASVSYAKSFTPTSGMALSCYDSVSRYNYILKIVDIGDQEAEVKTYLSGKFLSKEKAFFSEHSEGSYFVTNNEGLTFDFKNNDLKEGYVADGGDSRALECRVVRK